jgi:hypothetical protein
MACADADGLFTTIDVGEIGRNSEGAAFRSSSLGCWLELNALDILPPTPLPSTSNDEAFPFYFVADETFPLKPHIMRPSPRRTLNNRRRTFNYRLSQGRKSVEFAFRMMTSKFCVFETAICCKEDSANSVIRAA